MVVNERDILGTQLIRWVVGGMIGGMQGEASGLVMMMMMMIGCRLDDQSMERFIAFL